MVTTSSCGLTYQQRQDMFRTKYVTGCQVVETPPAAAPQAQPQVADPSEKEAIDEVISGSKAEVDRCYLESRELWADLEGLVAIKFIVKENGSVGDTAVLTYWSTIDEAAAVGCCIAQVAQTWKFAAPRDGKPFEVVHVFDLVTDIFRLKYRPGSTDVGKPQPSSGTEIHKVW